MVGWSWGKIILGVVVISFLISGGNLGGFIGAAITLTIIIFFAATKR